ncbi:hypothetical protein [Mycolicibacterium phlei]
MKSPQRVHRWLPAAVTALGLAVAGCQHGQSARADGVEARLDQPFVLAGGQQAVVAGTPLRLRFAEVLEDSRCPTELECAWTGQTRISVVVDDGRTIVMEFNTNPAPDQNRQRIHTGAYAITLQALEPYPATPQDTPGLSDYRATLLVTRPD